jgi:CHC2 zinc finger/Toprim domain
MNMSQHDRLTSIQFAKRTRLEDELDRRGIQLKLIGAEMCGPCPKCGGTDRFAVHLKRQLWNCRGCRRGGDVIDLVRHIDGISFNEAFRMLAGDRRVIAIARPVVGQSGLVCSDVPSDHEARQRAATLWRESIPIDGTLAERYLRQTRGLEIPNDMSDVLRFHSQCPFGPGIRHPCLVALFRNIVSNKPCAIHRIALRPDATKIDRKMLGPSTGAAIKLTDDEGVTYGLSVGEGIESTLAGIAMGFRPAWALGSAGSIRNFPVLAGIDCLTIITDHDDEGKRAADECRERWTDAGREVLIVMSGVESEDANDLVARRVA